MFCRLVTMLSVLSVFAALFYTSDAGNEVLWTKVHSAGFASKTPYAQPVVKNKRQCHYLCTADSTCKSVQYNTMSSACSLYTDDAPYLIPEDSGDSVYFTSPRLSLTWGTWYTVLRSTPGHGIHVYDTWMSTGGYNADQGELASRQSTPAGLYKSALIDSMWASVQRVKVSVYIAGVEQFYLEYDASGSDKSSWFARNKLVSSSVEIGPSDYYAMNHGCARRFYIMTHNSCEGDWGYVVVTEVGSVCKCTWDQQANPRFLFSNKPGGGIVQTEFSVGEVFMIQVLM